MRKLTPLKALLIFACLLAAMPASGSADVSAIAFGRSESKEAGVSTARGIWAMPASGGTPTMLIEDGGAFSIAPDGRRIAYFSGENRDIEASDIDGSDPVVIAGDDPSFYGGFDYGPGDLLALALERDDGLTVIGSDGSNRHFVYQDTESGADFTSPEFSPTGAEIVFQKGGAIWAIGADGSNPRQLREHGADPTYSPDGGKIAFFDCPKVAKRFECDLFLMNPDGSGATNITNTPGLDELSPAFSPDGTKIAFEIAEQYPTDAPIVLSSIATINVDGSGRADLTGTLPGEEYAPIWEDVESLPKPPPDPCKQAKKQVQKAKRRFKKLREKHAPAKAVAKAKAKIKDAKAEAKDAC